MYSRSRNNHAKNRTGRAGTDDALTQRARETKTAMSASQPTHPQQTDTTQQHSKLIITRNETNHPPQLKTARKKERKKEETAKIKTRLPNTPLPT
jgi:hypothetical protein